jgi:hypothetical protein
MKNIAVYGSFRLKFMNSYDIFSCKTNYLFAYNFLQL